jgi:urea transport system permease protein
MAGALTPARQLAFRGFWGARWAVVLVLVLALYPGFSSRFDQILLSTALTLALLAITVDLQWGYAGILNLGPAVSFGVGSYTYAILQRDIDSFDPTYLAFALGMLIPVLIGVSLAYAAFRVGTIPIYFALITLSLSLIFERWITVRTDLGSINGIIVLARPDFSIPGVTDYKIATIDDFYPFMVGVVAVCYLLSLAITSSKFGLVLRGIREDEERVQTLGYNTMAHKLVVVAVASAIGGLAGVIHAPLVGISHPSDFGFLISVQAFVWVAVGGQGTLIGPLVAAIVLTMTQEKLRDVSEDTYVMMIAGLFVAAVMFLPEGVAGWLARAGTRCRTWALNPLKRQGTVEEPEALVGR